MLEPWLWMTIIMTATELDNFLDLRDSEFAQPELHELARQMRQQLAESTPTVIPDEWWHIPLLTAQERSQLSEMMEWEKNVMPNLPYYESEKRAMIENPLLMERLLKSSTARAARSSYISHEMIKGYSADCAMHDRLRDQKHWSPFEHCAQAARGWIGNFHGWKQYRKTFAGESGGKVERDTCV
jgi:thymidylate synthase ThyX